ncbi:MAG: hypothetical protein PW792_02625 [Acidobacteriaceae bacterium]|nr:hypothetical protein [Acidobacteriaceae bacterium]
MAKRKRPAQFTAVKAVKANARERLGTPPSERVLPNTRDKESQQPKHKQTLANILEKASRED